MKLRGWEVGFTSLGQLSQIYHFFWVPPGWGELRFIFSKDRFISQECKCVNLKNILPPSQPRHQVLLCLSLVATSALERNYSILLEKAERSILLAGSQLHLSVHGGGLQTPFILSWKSLSGSSHWVITAPSEQLEIIIWVALYCGFERVLS